MVGGGGNPALDLPLKSKPNGPLKGHLKGTPANIHHFIIKDQTCLGPICMWSLRQELLLLKLRNLELQSFKFGLT